MKITDVTAMVLRLPEVTTACDGTQDTCLIRVETDAGITGWGEVDSCPSVVKAIVDAPLSHQICNGLRNALRGADPLAIDACMAQMGEVTNYYGRTAAGAHAQSGVNIALWDILGKACGQPVGRLLGGTYREKIKPYGSLLFEAPEGLRSTLQEALERGFRAFKLGWGPFGRVDRKTDEQLVRLARETVGPDVEIMVDAGGSDQFWPHGFKWAVETARMLVDYDVVWFEEALPPDDIEGHIRLREHAPLPIAGGEVLTRRQSFIPWIERGALDIVQPDATKVGGLSEARRILWCAYDHNVLLVSHGWNTAVGLAADLHLAAAHPTARWVEYITPSPYIEDIVATPFALDAEGLLPIPTGPGLGIELDWERVKRLSGEI